MALVNRAARDHARTPVQWSDAANAGFCPDGVEPWFAVNPNYRDGLYYYKWTGKPSAFKKRQYQWSWLGPTRIGITLSYDLLYRRIQKKGISFKSYETEIRHVPAGENIEEE